MSENQRLKKFDAVFSFGENCACAACLREMKLRICSGPMDWVGGAEFSTRVEFLISHFSDYLVPERLRLRKNFSPEDKEIEHDVYVDEKTGVIFAHDFPVGRPIAEHLTEVHEKYARRIARFYKLVEGANSVLFVWYSLEKRVSREEQLSAVARMDEMFGPGKTSVWVVEHDENAVESTGVLRERLSERAVRFSGYLKVRNSPSENDLLYGKKEVFKKILGEARIRASAAFSVRAKRLL